MSLTLAENKAQFIAELEKSLLYSLIEVEQQSALKAAINAATEARFVLVKTKFYEDEKTLMDMDVEIAAAEQKKTELIAKKKAFLEELSKKIDQDKIESEKAALDILKKLEDI